MPTAIMPTAIMPTAITRTAIITGASKGLGFALANQLADAGWNLIIDARDRVALHRAADALRVTGSAACRALPSGDGDRIVIEPIAGDIADPDHRAALIRAAQAHGRLDLLINNAGTLGPSPLPPMANFDLAALRETFEVNTIAPLALTQLALPLLRAAHGAVIDVTSDAAVEGYPGWGGYGASKAATEQLRNVLAAELHGDELHGGDATDLRVWRIDPGDLRTDMHQLAFPGEDISDRPLPETVAPGLLRLLFERPPSGRHRLADYVEPGSRESTGLSEPTGLPEPAALAEPAAPAGPRGSAVPTEPNRSGKSGGPVGLWLTLEVDVHAVAVAFYRDALGLSEVDGWSIDGEVGSVFAVGPDSTRGGGRLEIEQPGFPGVPTSGVRTAIEYADLAALTAVRERLGGRAGPIEVHARGHAGFTVRDPYGVELYLWSEK